MNGGRYLKASQPVDVRDGICRIVVLGSPGVGKTALTVRFLTKRFIGEYCPSLERIYRYNSTTTDDDDIRLDILDTAGQQSTDWKESYALWGDCFIFVYSITEWASFEEVHRLGRLVESARRSSALSCVVVGNKNDLVYQRQVSHLQGQQLASELGCGFYEVSACDWNQVGLLYEIFTTLHFSWRSSKLAREGRQRKASSSAKFKLAIQKVISGKGSSSASSSSASKRASLTPIQSSSYLTNCRLDELMKE